MNTFKYLACLIVLVVCIAVDPNTNAEQLNQNIIRDNVTAEKTHWLTISSGIRHNSTCRWYKNSKGRMCTKDEGRACKVCGG